ncbi:hypothetical protein DBR43_08425 [Pedobacter sp. KBW06]|nr:hypothetical protein DBR43_08425 [Pedobacter sp. KBW06]
MEQLAGKRSIRKFSFSSFQQRSIIANIEKPPGEYLQHFFYKSLFHFVFNLNPVNLVKTGYYLRTLKD